MLKIVILIDSKSECYKVKSTLTTPAEALPDQIRDPYIIWRFHDIKQR